MAKSKTTYFCQNCGSQYAKWAGQCTSCKAWNTLVEEVVERSAKPPLWEGKSPSKKAAKPLRISEIQTGEEQPVTLRRSGTGPGIGRRLRPGFPDPDRRRTGNWEKYLNAPDRSPIRTEKHSIFPERKARGRLKCAANGLPLLPIPVMS